MKPQDIKNYIKKIKYKHNLEDIYNLSLINFNKNDFIDFSNKLIKYLKEIAEEFIEIC